MFFMNHGVQLSSMFHWSDNISQLLFEQSSFMYGPSPTKPLLVFCYKYSVLYVLYVLILVSLFDCLLLLVLAMASVPFEIITMLFFPPVPFK